MLLQRFMHMSDTTEYTLDSSKLYKYHNKYTHRVIISLPGVEMLRSVKSSSGYKLSLERPIFTRTLIGRWSTVKEVLEIRGQLDNANSYYEFLKYTEQHSIQFFKKIYYGWLILYSNDPTELDIIVSNFFSSSNVRKTYTLDLEKTDNSVVLQVNPTYDYRIFMKAGKVEAKTVFDFVYNYKCKPSPSFSKSIWHVKKNSVSSSGSMYIQSNFFIDIKDESTLTVMSLMLPETIGKVATIVKR
jgi:hypothetical protein